MTKLTVAIIALLLGVAIGAGVPARAEAQAGTSWSSASFDHGPSDGAQDALVVTALAAFASVEVTILSLGVWRATQGNGFRPGWAVMELIWGTFEGLSGGLTVARNSNENAANRAVAAGAVALGALHIGHGIFSLVRGGPGRVRGPTDPPALSIDVASVAGGATLTVSGPTPSFF
ncbi:MAG: hypothetical protein JRH11_08120 [Deltaproteobacteria bacterium]|nr:hypothetical protein [Deltaproteobacteria bacterium]